MQRIAIIDIGSNSARLVISHIYKNGAYNMVYNQKESLRLAHLVENNRLTEEAFRITLDTLHNFAQMCHLYHVDKTIAVATAAIRNSDNGRELVDRIAQEVGIQLHIISGNTEAYISYLGVINTLNYNDGIIFDLGGGSTELILFKDRKVVNSISLPFGAVNITDIFHTRAAMPPSVYTDIRFFLSTKLAECPWLKQKNLPLIGVGGTARTLAKIIEREKKYPATKLHNYTYPARTFRATFNKLRATKLEDRAKISGLSASRSDIILGGCAIINCLLEATGCKEIITSGCGVREGLFYDYYAKTRQESVVADNILERSRENILKLYTANTEHARQVTSLTMTMFQEWRNLHKINESYGALLETAALLHDIGININYYSHARHSAYMIMNANLFGLTHREQIFTAAIAGWHNGVSKNYFRDKFYKDMLSEEDWKLVNKLACLLALAEAMDDTETRTVHCITPSLEKGKAILTIHATAPIKVELQLLNSHLNWFKKSFGVPLVLDVQVDA